MYWCAMALLPLVTKLAYRYSGVNVSNEQAEPCYDEQEQAVCRVVTAYSAHHGIAQPTPTHESDNICMQPES